MKYAFVQWAVCSEEVTFLRLCSSQNNSDSRSVTVDISSLYSYAYAIEVELTPEDLIAFHLKYESRIQTDTKLPTFMLTKDYTVVQATYL